MNKAALDIYELSPFLYNYRASLYPIEITTLNLGRFTILKKAKAAMLAFIIGGPNKRYELIHSFVVRESGVVLPLPGSHYEIRVYDEQGDLYGMRKCDWQPYTGKELASNRFKLKDLVEFIIGDHLHVGIIAGLPLSIDKVSRIKSRIRSVCDQSDNTYAVLYGLEYHDHLSECQLFKPRFNIAEETRQKLLDRLGDKSSFSE